MKFLPALLFLGFIGISEANETAVKVQSVGQVLDAARQLYLIAASNAVMPEAGWATSQLSTQMQARVESVMAPLKTEDQLVAFAIICQGIAGAQNAGDESFDLLFDHAFWESLRTLSDARATYALLKIKDSIRLDGGGSLYFKELYKKSQREMIKNGHGENKGETQDAKNGMENHQPVPVLRE